MFLSGKGEPRDFYVGIALIKLLFISMYHAPAVDMQLQTVP